MLARTLVTGAGGFIGANLCRRLLRDGHPVHTLVRPGTDMWRLEAIRGEIVVHEVELNDIAAIGAALDRARPDWLFHLAAHGQYSWQTDIEPIFATNTLASAQLLDAACVRGFDAFVQAGSASEYGRKKRPARESEWIEPGNAYAVSKAAATQYARAMALAREMHVVTLRLCTAYGRWEEPNRLMPTLAMFGLRGELPPLGDPRTELDFVFIDDVCEAFVLTARANQLDRGTILNVGSGVQTPLSELVDIVRGELAIAERPRWSTLTSRSRDPSAWVADCTLIEDKLGWRAGRGIAQGLRAVVDWLAQNPGIRAKYAAEIGNPR